MCSYKTLHHNENGYIIRCGKCSHIQVAFGTAAIALSTQQFTDFTEAVNGQYRIHESSSRTEKSISIPTYAECVVLIFTVSELEKLNDLLNQACITLEIEQLMLADEN